MRSRNAPRNATGNRNGVTLVMALLCLAASSMLVANLVRIIRLENQNRVNYENALQVDWLARYGRDRALRQLAIDPSYAGETWESTVLTRSPSRGSATSQVGRVTITLQRDQQPATLRVVARFPADQPNGSTKTLTNQLSAVTSISE